MTTSTTMRSLRDRVLRAGRWTLISYGLGQATSLISSLIMTRLLAPEMFGVMAIAIIAQVILFMLSDIGLQQHIVQSKRGDDPVFLDTAWSIQVIRGAFLWIMALLLSAALYFSNLWGWFSVRSIYASPILPFVIAANSFAAVILGFQSTKRATAHRNFDQKCLAQIDVAGHIAGLVFMILIGVISKSIWALVAGSLVSALTTTLLSHTWLSGYPNHFRLEKKAINELIAFGKWIFISSAVYVLTANGDRLLLGSFVDASILGMYAIAVLIVGAIRTGLGKLFSSVSLPALSEIARTDPSRLREVYYKFRVPGDVLLLFLAGLLFETGQLIIDLLYDHRYSAAGGMLQILALSLIVARYELSNQVYLALGITRSLAVINIVRCISLYALVPLLYFMDGTQAAIWGIALHGLLTVPFVYGFNARLGLIDIRLEFIVLVAFPIGYLCGSAVLFFWR